MKLRIDGATLRLRLSEDDIRRLAETGVISVEMPVRPGIGLTFALRAGDALAVALADHVLTVAVPDAWVGRWAGGDAGALRGRLDAGDGQTLTVVVEPDLA